MRGADNIHLGLQLSARGIQANRPFPDACLRLGRLVAVALAKPRVVALPELGAVHGLDRCRQQKCRTSYRRSEQSAAAGHGESLSCFAEKHGQAKSHRAFDCVGTSYSA